MIVLVLVDINDDICADDGFGKHSGCYIKEIAFGSLSDEICGILPFCFGFLNSNAFRFKMKRKQNQCFGEYGY